MKYSDILTVYSADGLIQLRLSYIRQIQFNIKRLTMVERELERRGIDGDIS